MDNRLSWIWLSLACGPASRTAVQLLCAFGSPEKIYRAPREKLLAAVGERARATVSRLENKDLSEASAVLRRSDEAGVTILTPDDARYPRTLYALRDAPIVLYCAGRLPDLDSLCCCAVVGTRKMSEYGRRMAFDIGRGLGAGGAVLVSGLALGVDGMAMAGALSAGGVTVGVLGCGIDIVYPPEHRDLWERVLENGAVLTEYPPGTPPAGANFPKRNRIISGLSQAVTVVEGDSRSGALITARHALYQGRDLYAVPGQIGESGAEGPNALIKSGARAVTSAVDILAAYEFLYPHSIRMLSAEEELAREVSPGLVQDVAVRMRPAAKDDKMYYGIGLYGGRRLPEPGRRRIPQKKMVERFSAAEPPRNEGKMIASSEKQLDSLGENEKKVFAAMKPDMPMLADDIAAAGLDMPQILAALTMLELAGAVEVGAGGYYLRRAEEPLAESGADDAQ